MKVEGVERVMLFGNLADFNNVYFQKKDGTLLHVEQNIKSITTRDTAVTMNENSAALTFNRPFVCLITEEVEKSVICGEGTNSSKQKRGRKNITPEHVAEDFLTTKKRLQGIANARP